VNCSTESKRHAGLLANVSVLGRSVGELQVSGVTHGVDSRGVDPAIIEVKERADRDREVNSLVSPSHFAQGRHVFRGDARRVVIHFADKAQEGLVFLRKRRGFQIFERLTNQLCTAQ